MKKILYVLSILTAFLFSGMTLAKNQQDISEAKLKGKRIVMIIAKQMFQEREFNLPKEIFLRSNATVIVASSTLSEAAGDGGQKVKPDMHINDIRADEFDAIVFVGGFGVTEYFDSPEAHRVAGEALKADKILAAICMAPRILANADVLKGKKATCFPSVRENLKAKGAIVTLKMVERDGNIITGNGPSAAEKFGEAIVSALIEQ
ncbi:DJ-1/PfpI family protein [Thermodesulfobacteriota bacterium]